MQTVLNIVVTLLVFGVLILAHEAGHFFVAKACKVKINEFAIGMGPAIYKKQGKETSLICPFAPKIYPLILLAASAASRIF